MPINYKKSFGVGDMPFDFSMFYTKAYYYDDSGRIEYRCFGKPGAKLSDKSWIILKSFYTATSNPKWEVLANGKASFNLRVENENGIFIADTYNYEIR